MSSVKKDNYKSTTTTVTTDFGNYIFRPVGAYIDYEPYNRGECSYEDRMDRLLVPSSGGLDAIWSYYRDEGKDSVLFKFDFLEKLSKTLNFGTIITNYFGNAQVGEYLEKTNWKVVKNIKDNSTFNLYSYTLYNDQIEYASTKGLSLNKLIDKDFSKFLVKKAKEVTEGFESNEIIDKELDKVVVDNQDSRLETQEFQPQTIRIRRPVTLNTGTGLNWGDFAMRVDEPQTTTAAGTAAETERLPGVFTQREWEAMIGPRPGNAFIPRIVGGQWVWVSTN